MSSDDPEPRNRIPDGNRTMQIDALTDVQLSEILPGEGQDVPDEGAGYDGPVAKPPPLPARRRSSPPWALLVIVVIAMAALGAIAGSFLLGGSPPAPDPVAAPAPEPARGPQRVEIGEIVIGAPAAAETDPTPPPSVEATGTSP